MHIECQQENGLFMSLPEELYQSIDMPVILCRTKIYSTDFALIADFMHFPNTQLLVENIFSCLLTDAVMG